MMDEPQTSEVAPVPDPVRRAPLQRDHSMQDGGDQQALADQAPLSVEFDIRSSRASLFPRNGHWVSALLIGVYTVVFLLCLIRFPYFSPFATVDEQVNYYLTARNYLRSGFASTAFLQDFSSSSNPAHHPYVYNHMPPGPELAVGIITKFFGEQYRLVRFAFSLLFLVGVVYYLRFVSLFLETLGLRGTGFAILFLSPLTFLHSIDHPAYAAFPFLAFYPLVALQSHYATGHRRPYYLALLVVFLSALYFVYQHTLMVVVCWLFLFMLKLVRFDRRHLIGFLLAELVGQVLHQAQSLLFFGPEVYFKDLWFTLSNRLFGVPTPNQLMEFYHLQAIVLHGTHTFDLQKLLLTIKAALWFPGRKWFVVAGVLMLIWTGVRIRQLDGRAYRIQISREVLHLARMVVWIAVTIGLPLLAFPAFSTDYGLSGMNEFFLGIGALTVTAWSLQEITHRSWNLQLFHSISQPVRSIPQWTLAGFFQYTPTALALFMKLQLGQMVKALMVIGIVASLAVGVVRVATRPVPQLRTLAMEALKPDPFADLVALGERLHGQVVMTNVYPTTVTFFTGEAGFGGCEFGAFHPGGGLDISQCFAAFIRGYPHKTRVQPKYYVLFRALFTGFTVCREQACLDDLRDLLTDRYWIVMDTKLFTVFDLEKRGRALPLTGHEGERITVSNVGTWDGRSGMFSGLEAVYQGGRWVFDLSRMEASNPNNLFLSGTEEDPIRDWSVSPQGTGYEVERMRDESGPFIRVRATRPSPYLVIMGVKPLSMLQGMPVSLRGQIRAHTSGKQVLTLYEDTGGQIHDRRTKPSATWTTLTLRVPKVAHLGPSANFSMGIFDVSEGDWFDIRELSLFAGILP